MVKDAFELAQYVRYEDDTESLDIPTNDSFLNQAKLEFSLMSLKASSDLTPIIYEAFEKVANRLNLDSDLVEIYILSSSDVQASCLSFNTEGCIITLSSSLVNLLKINELEFIIGHELGHFLLQHHRKHKDGSPESLISQRAMEISVDRIGMCACRDLNVAIKAIMRLLSGLEEKFLRFDAQSFLEQLSHDYSPEQNTHNLSTHPSLLLRAKSLARFANSKPYQELINNVGGTELRDIDNLIRKDLDFFMDSHTKSQIKDSKESVEFWVFVYALTRSGNLSKESQKELVNKYGEIKKDKLITMLKSTSKEQAKELILDKLSESIENFKNLAPNQAKKEINLIINAIKKQLSQSNLLMEIQRII
ncbi:MAG: M48 family metallopeptidase [Gammaproteobacteria bacterium]|nr:M48 family metallopeptidase [Gammaproteobacteria bacterium]